jgi:aldehyde dehydrogenase (NAD+)
MTVATSDPVRLLVGGLLVGDRWLTNSTGGTLEHINPATGRAQQTFPIAGRPEVDAAVAAAKAALPAWRRWRPDARRDVLRRVADRLRDEAAELGTIGSLENGTPRLQAVAMAPSAAGWFDYYAGWADKLTGEVIDPFPKPGFNYTLPEPVGVVAVIVTWNGPLMAFGMAVAPALAAGCCVVIKPAELTPFSPARFGRICLESGLPPGVVTIVPGGPDAGDALVRHPDVAKISFTGGIETARRIQSACAESLTPLVLELGGKSPNIIFADADVDRAASLSARFTSLARQGCSLPTRLLVEESIYDRVLERLLGHLRQVVVGDPLDERTSMGPVVTEAACHRILGMIERAEQAPAGELLLGGRRLGGELADGFFIGPTVFGDVDRTSEIARDEVFGPVLTVMKFRDEDEAIAIANGTAYGLAAYVHTSDVTRAHRVASQLDVGNVAVNNTGPASAGPGVPFGGVKASGYGRQGGRAGLLEFVRTKNVTIDMG